MTHPESFLNVYMVYYLPEKRNGGKVQEAKCQDQNHKAFLFFFFFLIFRMKKRFDKITQANS